MGISLLYGDKNFLVFNKPAGMLVHSVAHRKGQIANKEPTVVDWALEHYPEVKGVGDPLVGSGHAIPRPGIVHRLDRDTSGVLLVARNQKSFDYFKKLFSSRDIKKTYLALVCGVPKEKRGVVEKPIAIKSSSVKRTIFKGKVVKDAVTEYQVIESRKWKLENREGEVSLLRVMPKTGRTHQIRVHLASIGHPVMGDALYGGKNALPAPRQMLHALSLEFRAPTGERIKIEADLPMDFITVIDGFGKSL